MSSIIPFDSGRSYVVRNQEVTSTSGPKITDHLGRTEEDRQFIALFDLVMRAAASGNLASCESAVKSGFVDFNATSFNKYERLDGVSPLQVAERNGHLHIVEYFKTGKISSTAEKPLLTSVAPESKSPEFTKYEYIRDRFIRALGGTGSDAEIQTLITNCQLDSKMTNLHSNKEIQALFIKIMWDYSSEELLAIINGPCTTSDGPSRPENLLGTLIAGVLQGIHDA